MSYTAMMWSLASALLVGIVLIGLVEEPGQGPFFITSDAVEVGGSSKVLTSHKASCFSVVRSKDEHTSIVSIDSQTAVLQMMNDDH